MRLHDAPIVDVRQRFREELQDLPSPLRLDGNAMQQQIARLLLKEHGIVTHPRGMPVQLMSMERYCSAFLSAFLEEREPPTGKFLLTTIPEQELILFAQGHDIAVVLEEHDDARRMLDRIAARQPQTYFSLRKSSDRLKAAADMLRRNDQK